MWNEYLQVLRQCMWAKFHLQLKNLKSIKAFKTKLSRQLEKKSSYYLRFLWTDRLIVLPEMVPKCNEPLCDGTSCQEDIASESMLFLITFWAQFQVLVLAYKAESKHTYYEPQYLKDCLLPYVPLQSLRLSWKLPFCRERGMIMPENKGHFKMVTNWTGPVTPCRCVASPFSTSGVARWGLGYVNHCREKRWGKREEKSYVPWLSIQWRQLLLLLL